MTTVPKCPPPPRIMLRRGLMFQNGQVSCDEPHEVDGQVVGYCLTPVWPPRLQGRWLRRPGHPGKAHHIEWWTA